MTIGRDYIGVSAGAVIRDESGRFFLAKRSQGARDDQGRWEFPGGSVQMFETREQAAIRNVFQKYNLQVAAGKVLGVYDVIDHTKGDHWLSTTFMCRAIGGEAKNLIPESCEEIGWFESGEVRKLNLSRISRLNLKDLQSQFEVAS
jgi:ADP-ribose pyrophosphatase YjhB (NUDIX family)